MPRTTASLFALAGVLLVTPPMACSPAPVAAPVERVPQAEPPAEFADPPSEGHATGEQRLRTVYVPAYSHLQERPEHSPRMLSILLSVRNVDSMAVVTLTHVDYFDTSGHRVRRYLDKPLQLRPLQTAEFIVENQDVVGGSGANFLVYWEGPSDAHPLLTESVQWGHFGAGYISFTSRGVELDRRPDPAAFMVTGDDTSATVPPAPAASPNDTRPAPE